MQLKLRLLKVDRTKRNRRQVQSRKLHSAAYGAGLLPDESTDRGQQAFGDEVAANVDCIQTLNSDEQRGLIAGRGCKGSKDDGAQRLTADQLELLVSKTTEKSYRLEKVNNQQRFAVAMKDLNFWLNKVEQLLASDDYGKNLASLQNSLEKHQLLEADILVHKDRMKEMNALADSLMESDQFNRPDIQERRKSLNDRYDRVKNVAALRRGWIWIWLQFEQFSAKIEEEESWLTEKRQVLPPDDNGETNAVDQEQYGGIGNNADVDADTSSDDVADDPGLEVSDVEAAGEDISDDASSADMVIDVIPGIQGDGTIVYAVSKDIISTDDAKTILENPDHDKVCKMKVSKPKGGAIYLFHYDDEKKRKSRPWRVDGYYYGRNGGGTTKVYRDKTVVMIKRTWQISQPDLRNKGNPAFCRLEFELSQQNGFVLVQYVGNEKRFVPGCHGKAKTEMARSRVHTRTDPTVIEEIKKKDGIPPKRIHETFVTDPSIPGRLQATSVPKNLKQVSNALFRKRHQFRLTHDGVFNTFYVAHNLDDFVQRILVVPKEANMLVCLVKEEMMGLLKDVLKLPNSRTMLSYDTTFGLGSHLASFRTACRTGRTRLGGIGGCRLCRISGSGRPTRGQESIFSKSVSEGSCIE